MKKVSKIFLAVAVLLCAVLIFAACAVDNAPPGAGDGNAGDGGDAPRFDGALPSGRLIVFTGDIEISFIEQDENYSLEAEFNALVNFINASLEPGEWFDSMNRSGQRAAFTARIRTDRLNDYIAALQYQAGMQNVRNLNLSATDVTLNYSNIAQRIIAFEAERARLITFMEEATSMHSLLEINTRLSFVDSQIIALQTQLNTYDAHLDYSILHITVIFRPYVPAPFPWWAVIVPLVLLLVIAVAVTVVVLEKRSRRQRCDG